jgi:hypothetical protein
MKIEFWMIGIAIVLTTAVIITIKITAARRRKKRHYLETIYPLW